jgi:cell division protein FtsB
MAERRRLSLERRRARTVLAAAGLFALVVLGTSFPLSSVLSQRSALAASAHQLATLRAENAALARQAARLRDPATVSALARHDYGLVPQGQKAYEILPPPGTARSRSAGPGHVPLDGPPVAPGSARAQALLGVSGAPRTGGRHGASGRGGGDSSTTGGAEPGDFWGRVARTLEFWH